MELSATSMDCQPQPVAFENPWRYSSLGRCLSSMVVGGAIFLLVQLVCMVLNAVSTACVSSSSH